MELPFQEQQVNQKEFIRKFSKDTDSGEFTWHRDREDRIIKATHQTDWLIQIDNQLPQSLNEEIFIPAGVYHRVIKGNGDLEIRVKKLF
jgi:hypothetical protein